MEKQKQKLEAELKVYINKDWLLIHAIMLQYTVTQTQ